MPLKTKIETRDFLSRIPIPQRTSSYTPISHVQILDLIYENLDKNGFKVAEEIFNMTNNGQIVNSHFKLDLEIDNELKFEIATLNSYNKQKRFTGVGGSVVRICSNGHILGDCSYGSIRRKHSGSADIDITIFIPEMIKRAHDNFEILIKQKERMKEIEITKKITAQLIGDLYLNEGLIADAQMSIIKREFDNPSYDYGTSENSIWTVYNNITVGTRETHPSKWIETHQKLNSYFTKEFLIS